MTEQDEKIAELLAELDACADANDPEDVFQRAIDTIKSEREKRRRAERRVEVLERTFRHTHVKWRGRDTDMCEKCQLDLRDDIHMRWAESVLRESKNDE